MKDEKKLSLKTLTKSSVWDLQENDIFRLWAEMEKDADLKDNSRRYHDIIRCAFEIEEIKSEKPEIIKKYEDRGFKIGQLKTSDNDKQLWGLKKRAISRITDLTYENITHISAAHLLEVIDRNFGGGWESLSQSIRDIIESGFEISTTTLPKDRLKKAGGMYEKKVADGFDVLEIEKGTWIEAIFAKVKPKSIKAKLMEESTGHFDDEDDEDEDLPEEIFDEDEDDDFDEDMLTEESYRTTFETDPDDLTLDNVDASDDDY